ncbi:MAG: replicative DNA helicase [Dehalococcoidia bacterium]|nr:replicative DNA helicase [Dehalococcoidia bacterium]
MVYTDRLLPHSVEAEESVIGAVLIDPDTLPKITGIVAADDFYVTKNRWCFEACLALFDRSEAINQVTIAEELNLKERLEEIGGTSYLAHLVRTVPTTIHVEHYATIVQRTSIMRRLIRTADEIAAIGYEGDADSEAALSKAEDLLYRVRTARSTRDFVHIRQVLDQYMEEMASLQASPDIHLGPIATGFPDLDKLLGGGLQRSDLIIVAARPSLGKSTLAFNIARHASGQLARVAVFSLEMSAEQIGIRLVASEANIDSSKMRASLLMDQEVQLEHDAIGYLSELPIYIDETPFQRIVEMRSKITRLHNEEPIDLLIVDYIQLIAGSSGRSENRVMDMGEISRSLKSIARELDVPVLALSQLSRAPEQRLNHRPLLSDLRESGSIEQDADVVAFIYREDKYVTREEWEKRSPSNPYPSNVAELIVAKHRNGPTGSVHLYFRDDVVRFESMTRPNEAMEYA